MKKALAFISLIVILICPFYAYFYLIPAELHTTDNLLTVVGLFIAFYTFWATIGIGLFIYWLQDRNAKKEEQRRIEQAKAAMLLTVENAFELYFFMPQDDRDAHYCDGAKDVLSTHAGELRNYLSTEEFDHLIKVVNTISKQDCEEASYYVRDWLRLVYLSSYQKYLVSTHDYKELLDRKTFNLINKLKGKEKQYTKSSMELDEDRNLEDDFKKW